jgi:transcriptional regulator with XRE-family HTH domain
MDQITIRERVREYIVGKDLSQKIIAENMNTSEARLSLMLTGKRRMTVDDYLAICKAISVPPTRFLND